MRRIRMKTITMINNEECKENAIHENGTAQEPLSTNDPCERFLKIFYNVIQN